MKKIGCEVIPLGGDSKAVISGDRTGVDKQDCYKVVFEFKCLFPGKKYATGVHYSLPIYYTTQVLSQMAAKGCSEVACISFTPELIERMSTGLQMFKQSGSCKCYIETMKKENGFLKKKDPASLKVLVSNHIKSWSIDWLNVAYAQLNFQAALKEWDSENILNGSCIIHTDSGENI